MAIGLIATGDAAAIAPAFSLANAQFRYEPYPVGVARPVFTPAEYDSLLDAWPSTHLFQYRPDLGKKYALSEVNNAEGYHRFVGGHPLWLRMYRWVKSRAFVTHVLTTLAGRRVDLGLHADPVHTTHYFSPWSERVRAAVVRRFRRRTGHAGVLRARFEFTMMPADGGCIKPHTDHFTKLITLVVSMARPGEWDPAWGGGTDVLRPKDVTANFNYLNRQMEFAEMDVIDSYAYEPNQCVLFIKTFNSHHSVRPMTGPPAALRRTLTINIERVVA